MSEKRQQQSDFMIEKIKNKAYNLIKIIFMQLCRKGWKNEKIFQESTNYTLYPRFNLHRRDSFCQYQQRHRRCQMAKNLRWYHHHRYLPR